MRQVSSYRRRDTRNKIQETSTFSKKSYGRELFEKYGAVMLFFNGANISPLKCGAVALKLSGPVALMP